MALELGTFSFCYRSLAVHGFGISSSSNFAVLYQASQLLFRDGPPTAINETARKALKFDRWTANNLCVAADDVYPIAYGGVVTVHTRPVTNDEVDDGVQVQAVEHDPHWIAKHVVIAFRRYGKRHEVKDLLSSLFDHKERVAFVQRISEEAKVAAHAITKQDIKVLAKCVENYRKCFDEWTENRYINNTVAALVKQVDNMKSNGVLAWKPPGAGAAEAVAFIVKDVESRDSLLNFFKREKPEWWCSPMYVTTGLCAEYITGNGEIRFTAGHRFDFVGGADLGQSPKINEAGCCCSCAIEPRSEMVLEGAE